MRLPLKERNMATSFQNLNKEEYGILNPYYDLNYSHPQYTVLSLKIVALLEMSSVDRIKTKLEEVLIKIRNNVPPEPISKNKITKYGFLESKF